MGVITRIRPFKTAHDSKGVAMGSLNLDAGSSAKLSGERELVFLANSGKQMDNGLTVDLSTLEAPLIDGSKKLVSQLTDDDKLALPLLIDHSWSIEQQAGTITKLTVDEDGLEAVAKLATVQTGELGLSPTRSASVSITSTIPARKASSRVRSLSKSA